MKTDKTNPQWPEGQMVWIPPGFALSSEPPAAPTQESHLWDYLYMIWRKRWLLAMMFLLCFSLAALKNYRSTPIYQTSAKLRIEQEEPNLISFQGESLAVRPNKDYDFINTQLQVIQSGQLAQRVIDKLGLYKKTPPLASAAAVSEHPGKTQSSLLGRLLLAYHEVKKMVGLAPDVRPLDKMVTKEEAQEIDRQMRINFLLDGLMVAQLHETEIIMVSYRSTDPRRCTQIANALCEEYIKWTYESKYQSYDYARKWLKTKMDEMKGKLEESENALIKLTGGKDFVVSSDSQFPQQLESYHEKIVDAERDMFQKEFELQHFKGGKNFNALRSLGNKRLDDLLDSYATYEIEIDKLQAKQYGEQSKEVQEIRSIMSRIGLQLEDSLAQARKKAQFEYDQVKANHDYLKKMYDTEKDRGTGVQKNMIQYNILKREVETNRDLYNSLLQRWKELGLTSGVKAGYASIIEPALPPMAPSFPDKKRTLLLGALIGLLLGIGMIFFLDYMDTSVKDPEELERLVRLPILGYVSHCDLKRNKGDGRVSVELFTHYRPRSEYAESIRSIRTSIQYSRAGGAPKTILVTSCMPGEGKTSIATNLAISLASRDRSVLLIDADLKKPSLNKLFNVECKLGLAEVLTGKFDGCNLPETEIKNLFVMPSGSKPPNPVDLLDSEIMRKFIATAAIEYDHVIIDSTPALNMADAAVLAPNIDGVILVVQPGRTPREAVRRVKERLMDIQANILGLVINNPTRNTNQRYGAQYGYGYGYGAYSYGKKNPYGFSQGTGRTYPGDEEQDVFDSDIKEIVDISIAAQQIDPQDKISDGHGKG